MKPDLSKILSTKPAKDQFERRMRHLESLKPPMVTKNIRSVVDEASSSLSEEHRSFVIYGDPQSGKTEMMIGLNAKLLDMGFPIIINLVNDSVDTLNQNKDRFTNAGLNPAPKIYSEVEEIIPGLPYVFLSTKNAKNLDKLNDLVKDVKGKDIVVIDDEADHATPNAKVNDKDMKSKIHESIGSLLRHGDNGMEGVYIGVTATPARLDLNATYDNDSQQWICFPPHDKYVGQDFFFPQSVKGEVKVEYRLKMFPQDQENDREKLHEAILSFLCSVAFLNVESEEERNFSMLIHTSRNKAEHLEDKKILNTLISDLSDPNSPSRKARFEEVLSIADDRFPQKTGEIAEYIAQNITRARVGVINSNTPAQNKAGILNPASPFTFAIGGDIVSRGLTFKHLLSMYFTRTVKANFQQDTYIQRARMFGARDKSLLPYFELWIPEKLFQEWHTCFNLHKMSVDTIKEKRGAPVWIAEGSIVPTQRSGINRAAVDMQGGQMTFDMFEFRPEYDKLMADGNSEQSAVATIDKLHKILGEECFSERICTYIKSRINTAGEPVYFHQHSDIGREGSKYKQEEIDNIQRVKGFFGASQLNKRNEIHHLRMFVNPQRQARLFYKLRGEKVRFISRS